MNGYLQGDAELCRYLGGIDRKTLWRWLHDASLKRRELLKPRVIRGQKYYRIANVERFMDPALNTEDTGHNPNLYSHTNDD